MYSLNYKHDDCFGHYKSKDKNDRLSVILLALFTNQDHTGYKTLFL